MLTFEAALAHAQARAGIFTQDVADTIAAHCRVELFDVAALYGEAARAGTPVIPLLRMLNAHVDEKAQTYVHWGATSQDAIDTALMLEMRDGLDILIAQLDAVCQVCSMLAEQHRHTLMVGRTLLQQAVPITFGLKAVRWLALALRQLQALHEHRMHSLVVQLGGAAGTLAVLGKDGSRVVELLAAELHLNVPDLPWHTERDCIAQIASTLSIVAGAMGKIAGDIVLLAQTEVGEVSEGVEAGKGGSSAMPQKHNPVNAIFALAAARHALGVLPVIVSAMVQEHERAAGAWQAEWEAIPSLFRFTAEAAERVHSSISNLHVYPERMRANLDMTHGLVMAESLTVTLAPYLGKAEAQRIVQTACEQAIASGTSLREEIQKQEQVCTVLSLEQIDAALNPATYLGSTDVFMNRSLAAYHAARLVQGGNS
jgi:3-carboxy-cis,cis-muconate cycloisomerase